MLLRQRHAEQAALVPQLVERDLVALAVVREHQAEHEQHRQKRADRAPPHPPAGIAVIGRLGRNADKVAPQRDEPPVGCRQRERRSLRRTALASACKAFRGTSLGALPLLRSPALPPNSSPPPLAAKQLFSISNDTTFWFSGKH